MKRYTLEQTKDELIGLTGTPERDQYEFELKLELIGDMIQMVRKQRNMTQQQLGRLIGVKKAQISRLENNTGNVTLETILKVFNALEAKVDFSIKMLNQRINVA